MLIRWLLLFFSLVVSSGCMSINVGEEKEKVFRHIGYVEVFVPRTDERIEAVKIQSLGLSLEAGFSLGWRDEELVWVPLKVPASTDMPYQATCSVVVIVRSDVEAQHAYEVLTGVEGEDICVVSFQ